MIDGPETAKKLLMIRQLARKAHHAPEWRTWLPKDPSAAFICCIGAGPWKYGRRRSIQLQGLTKLAGRDIHDLSGREKWFPLAWQNEMLNALTANLREMDQPKHAERPKHKVLFSEVAALLGRWQPLEGARLNFYSLCGRPKGTKVLGMFLRDYAGVPAFPVDRHVRRILQELHLPTKEKTLLDLFEQADMDPIPVARMLGSDRLDGGNPDWSGWPDKPAPERIK